MNQIVSNRNFGKQTMQNIWKHEKFFKGWKNSLTLWERLKLLFVKKQVKKCLDCNYEKPDFLTTVKYKELKGVTYILSLKTEEVEKNVKKNSTQYFKEPFKAIDF